MSLVDFMSEFLVDLFHSIVTTLLFMFALAAGYVLESCVAIALTVWYVLESCVAGEKIRARIMFG